MRYNTSYMRHTIHNVLSTSIMYSLLDFPEDLVPYSRVGAGRLGKTTVEQKRVGQVRSGQVGMHGVARGARSAAKNTTKYADILEKAIVWQESHQRV